MAEHSSNPPESLCILRLSALGDVVHMVPIVRTLQKYRPDTQLTWIIGKGESRLLAGLPGVEMLVYDKGRGREAQQALASSLRGRRFEVFLAMQLSLRANLLGRLVHAPRRLGYDWKRSRELHSLFINRRIAAGNAFHVQDVFFLFLEALGIDEREMRWDIPVPAEDMALAESLLPGDQPTLLINACSSHALRNWHTRGYAAAADYAVRRHGLRVALIGGRSELERRTADEIIQLAGVPILDLVGKDTLKAMLALIGKARLVLTPDSAPAHIGSALGVPVIGLHAATSSLRSGPYRSLDYCVDKFEQAALKFCKRPVSKLRWGTRIEYPGVMDLISVDEVLERMDAVMAAGGVPR